MQAAVDIKPSGIDAHVIVQDLSLKNLKKVAWTWVLDLGLRY